MERAKSITRLQVNINLQYIHTVVCTLKSKTTGKDTLPKRRKKYCYSRREVVPLLSAGWPGGQH